MPPHRAAYTPTLKSSGSSVPTASETYVCRSARVVGGLTSLQPQWAVGTDRWEMNDQEFVWSNRRSLPRRMPALQASCRLEATRTRPTPRELVSTQTVGETRWCRAGRVVGGRELKARHLTCRWGLICRAHARHPTSHLRCFGGRRQDMSCRQEPPAYVTSILV